MLKSAAKKVAWVGRTASMVFGLALVLALLFGVASMAFAANGQNFILGSLKNSATAVSKLTMTGTANGSVLQLVQQSTGLTASGLGITVPAGKVPLTVNPTAGKATNLNADKIDNLDSTQLAMSTHTHSGADITSGTVAEARIDPSVARDAEVMDNVKANDGTGSNLDADTLDGLNSSAFARPEQIARAKAGLRGGTSTLSNTPQEFASVTVTFPANGYALFYMESDFSARQTGTWINGFLKEGTATLYGWYWDPGDVDNWYDQTQPRTHFMPVSAGTHTYKLYLDEQNAAAPNFSNAHDAQVSVMYFSASL